MASWVFWYVYGTVAYIVLSLVFLFMNKFAIKLNFELWRGKKFIVVWKRGNVVTDWQILSQEPQLGIKRNDKTYKIDERKGIQFRRLPIHVFDEDNIAELDFSDKNNIYPPHKFDPAVFCKCILRALASGVNDHDWKTWVIIGIILMVIISGCAIAGAYFGYTILEQLSTQGIIQV